MRKAKKTNDFFSKYCPKSGRQCAWTTILQMTIKPELLLQSRWFFDWHVSKFSGELIFKKLKNLKKSKNLKILKKNEKFEKFAKLENC